MAGKIGAAACNYQQLSHFNYSSQVKKALYLIALVVSSCSCNSHCLFFRLSIRSLHFIYKFLVKRILVSGSCSCRSLCPFVNRSLHFYYSYQVKQLCVSNWCYNISCFCRSLCLYNWNNV